MMTSHTKRNWYGKNSKKAMHLGLLAFFLGIVATSPAQTATNWVTGTAYGTNYTTLATAGSISSIADDMGSLDVRFAGTTNLALNHDIEGYISVSNNFSSFTIDADAATLRSSQYAVLTVAGGSNLVINGGGFSGEAGSSGIVFPPIPGQPVQTNTVSSAARGGLIYGTENVVISRTGFSGATYAPDEARSLGSEGLMAVETEVTFKDNGINSSILTGGSGGDVSLQGFSVRSSGGSGLYAENSTLIISNGTFKGGNGGNTAANSSFSATSTGGHALHAINTTIEIIAGSFTGGNAGNAISLGSGATSSTGGSGVYAADSSINILGGTFTGGSASDADTSAGGAALHAESSTIQIGGNAVFNGGAEAAALYIENSDLATTGGSFGTTNGIGLVSIVDATQSKIITLNSGTFGSIELRGDGTQFLTSGTGLTVQEAVQIDGGTVLVDNLSNLPFHNVRLIDGDLYIINDFTLSSEGSFRLESSSSHAIFDNLGVSSNATLFVGEGSVNASGNFALLAGGIVAFSLVDGLHGALSANTAFFQTNSTIQVDATMASLEAGTTNVVLLSTGTIGGISVIDSAGLTNLANGELIATNINIEASTIGRTSLSDILVDGSDLVFRFDTTNLREYWNATGQFGEFSDELDQLLINHPEMNVLINQYEDPELSRMAIEQTYFTIFNTFQTSLQGLRAAVGPSISRGTEFREELKLAPPGAKGPERNNQLRGWSKYYGQYYSRDDQSLNSAYDTVLHGGVIGIDTSIGNLLVGIGGGASRYSSDYDSDAREDVTAYHGNVYATYGADRAYVDAGCAYSHNRVETQTGDPFRLEGKFNAHLASAYLGGGYDLIRTKGGTVFTPEVSVQYSRYDQDAYTEKSEMAAPRIIEEFDADSILGTLGMNITLFDTKVFDYFGYKLDGRVHWMHEFNPEPSDVSFMLEDGSNHYSIAYPALDEDIYRVGVGCSFFNTGRSRPKNVMLRLDFDELFGQDFNSHNLAAKLVYAF